MAMEIPSRMELSELGILCEGEGVCQRVMKRSAHFECVTLQAALIVARLSKPWVPVLRHLGWYSSHRCKSEAFVAIHN